MIKFEEQNKKKYKLALNIFLIRFDENLLLEDSRWKSFGSVAKTLWSITKLQRTESNSALDKYWFANKTKAYKVSKT